MCGVTLLAAVPTSAFTVSPIGTTTCTVLAPQRGPQTTSSAPSSPTVLHAYGKYGNGRSSSRYASGKERSKRQERVGHVVRTELATIIHRGYPVKYADPLDDDLLKRINIVNADVSPDLRNARITVSVTGAGSSDTIDKRRAYSWLVKNCKMIKHAMAQRLSHMKSVPDLTFVQVDVGAAVDVMHLIEKVSEGGYKREKLGTFGENDDSLPMGYTLEDDEDWDDEDGWEDFDEDDGDEEDE